MPPKIKVSTKKAKPSEVVDAVDTKARINALLAQLNKDMKGLGRIDTGEDIKWMDPPRIRTGILGLDVATAGGIPRGSAIEFWGPFSSGKTSTSMHIGAAVQRQRMPLFLAVAETFSKPWARECGLWIKYAKDEYTAVKEVLKDDAEEVIEQMQAYDEGGEAQKLGEVVLVQHTHGDGLLEAVVRIVKSNLFPFGVIDSIAALRNTRQLEEMEVGDEERGGGGTIQMLNRFFGRVYSAYSTRYDADGTPNPQGIVPNGTSVCCLNQVVVDQNAQPGRGRGGIKYKPAMGEKIRHWWHLSLEFSAGERFGDQQLVDGSQRWMPWAREFQIRVAKSKCGPDGRTAAWKMYTDHHEGWRKGSIDMGEQTRIWGLVYGVIHNSGAWYVLPDGTRINGKEKVDSVLNADAAMRASIDEVVIERARR